MSPPEKPAPSDPQAPGLGVFARATSLLEQWGCGWCGFVSWSLVALGLAGCIYLLYLVSITEPYPRIFMAGLSLSSFGVSPSALQLNGTWHLEFSLVYKGNPTIGYFARDGAEVSLYYKGAYLAGVDLHTFRVGQEHPLPLEVNVDATRSDVPGWLARDLAEVRSRVGVMQMEVQFVAKHGEESEFYLCGNLTLGFSTAEEAKLIGDGPVRCPLIA